MHDKNNEHASDASVCRPQMTAPFMKDQQRPLVDIQVTGQQS